MFMGHFHISASLPYKYRAIPSHLGIIQTSSLQVSDSWVSPMHGWPPGSAACFTLDRMFLGAIFFKFMKGKKTDQTWSGWKVFRLPLWKMWNSVGMILPNIWKNNPNVPNHQPGHHSNHSWLRFKKRGHGHQCPSASALLVYGNVGRHHTWRHRSLKMKPWCAVTVMEFMLLLATKNGRYIYMYIYIYIYICT